MSLSISFDNVITVRCPWDVQFKDIESFVDSKQDWIEKVVTRNATQLAKHNDVLEYKTVLYYGKEIPVVLSDKNLLTPTALYVKKMDCIGETYVKACSDEFLKRVNELAEQTQLTPASVSIKSYKGRWGCCDSKNNLIFNCILFMLPKDVQRYVIVHELCHTLCHNHSFAFWKLVSDYEPDYKNLKKKLATYDFLTTLY